MQYNNMTLQNHMARVVKIQNHCHWQLLTERIQTLLPVKYKASRSLQLWSAVFVRLPQLWNQNNFLPLLDLWHLMQSMGDNSTPCGTHNVWSNRPLKLPIMSPFDVSFNWLYYVTKESDVVSYQTTTIFSTFRNNIWIRWIQWAIFYRTLWSIYIHIFITRLLCRHIS